MRIGPRIGIALLPVAAPSRLDRAFSRIQEIAWLASFGDGGVEHAPQETGEALRSRDTVPSLVDVIAQSVYIMQVRITRARMAGDPPDVLLAPKLGHIRLLEFHRAAEAVDAGYRCAEIASDNIAEQLR